MLKKCTHFILMTFAVLCHTQARAQVSIPNNGFESWQMAANVDMPVGGWYTSDGDGLDCTPLSSIKSTDKAGGNYSILLQTGDCAAVGGIHEGYAIINVNITAVVDSLKFKYKSQRTGADSAMAEVMVFAGQTQVGRGHYSVRTSQATFKDVIFPITYFSAQAPTYAMIVLTSDGIAAGVVGNKFWVDDLYFTSKATTGINATPYQTPEQLTIYPIPAKDNVDISFSLTADAAVDIQLINMMGAQVLQHNAQYTKGSHKQTIDISALPQGMYQCRLQTGYGARITGKIIKQ